MTARRPGRPATTALSASSPPPSDVRTAASAARPSALVARSGTASVRSPASAPAQLGGVSAQPSASTAARLVASTTGEEANVPSGSSAASARGRSTARSRAPRRPGATSDSRAPRSATVCSGSCAVTSATGAHGAVVELRRIGEEFRGELAQLRCDGDGDGRRAVRSPRRSRPATRPAHRRAARRRRRRRSGRVGRRRPRGRWDRRGGPCSLSGSASGVVRLPRASASRVEAIERRRYCR